jgi:hypothetical protein
MEENLLERRIRLTDDALRMQTDGRLLSVVIQQAVRMLLNDWAEVQVTNET